MTRYPPLPRRLHDQLRRVPASRDGKIEYRPSAVTLDDGTRLPCVYVVERALYIRHWGIYPEDDRGKRSVAIDAVHSIEDSPNRLPAHLADELYRAGESGMGYTVFTVEFRDGSRQAYVTGNAVDFIEPPAGLQASDAVRVGPHAGRRNAKQSLEYYWCLYDGIEGAGHATGPVERGTMKDVVEAVIRELDLLGDPEVIMIHPEQFKGGFVLRYPRDIEVRYLDWEFEVSSGEVQLFGSKAHEGFSGNMFSPEHLQQHIGRIAGIVRRT